MPGVIGSGAGRLPSLVGLLLMGLVLCLTPLVAGESVDPTAENEVRRRPVRDSLDYGRLPERTNGAASKAVVVLCATKGSNPLPSAKQLAELPLAWLLGFQEFCEPLFYAIFNPNRFGLSRFVVDRW